MNNEEQTGIDATVAAVLRGRRTVAAFRPDVPERATVRAALELALWAPNHKKTQPWRFHWLGTQSISQVLDLNIRLLARTRGMEEARLKTEKWARIPGWIVVTSSLADDPLVREEDYAACCCAIQNLMVALWSAGIGSKWSTGDVTRDPDFLRLLDVDPDQHRVVGLVWYGYPEILPEQNRAPLDTVLIERS